jgi:hypothetical protein
MTLFELLNYYSEHNKTIEIEEFARIVLGCLISLKKQQDEILKWIERKNNEQI